MPLNAINPTQTAAWKALAAQFDAEKNHHLKDWFAQNPNRAQEMRVLWEDFYVDFSKNRLSEKTLQLLIGLADELDLKKGIEQYFSGAFINQAENRAVLHTALRAPADAEILVQGNNIIPEIQAVQQKMKAFSDDIVLGRRTGFTGKPFTDVVNIGIGGSDLGPAMVVDALKFYKNHLTVHFVSNVDGDHVMETIKNLNPETTLFLVVSKTFTTQETLSNATTIRDWFLQSAPEAAVSRHFVAVSTNLEAVSKFGIDRDNIFPMWDWVGGRFSLWSAVGLSISLAIGHKNFEALLKGAHKMDRHFRDTPFRQNIPVLLALISIWYSNFFETETEAIIPYTQYLNQFATYLQQGIMESNGKSVDRIGQRVSYQTGMVIWGEPGTNAQHAFFQLMHQGTKLIPADFIGFAKSLYGNRDHQDKLMSNFMAQTEALMNGKTQATVRQELMDSGASAKQIEILTPYKIFDGNRPTNSIFIDQLTPESLGKLIAIYEHRIFVQGYIWNIFSYDQFGVELGKHMAKSILGDFNGTSKNTHDASTAGLIAQYRSKR